MSDEDDAEVQGYSNSDRLDAEMRQLLWAFAFIIIAFFAVIGAACYTIINLVSRGT